MTPLSRRLDAGVAATLVLALALVGARELRGVVLTDRAEEAAENLEAMVTAAAVHHVIPRAGDAAHRCPHPIGSPQRGATGFVPPLEVRCDAGPGGRCVPSSREVSVADGPHVYDGGLWDRDGVWQALQFRKYKPHRFHFQVEVQSGPANARGVASCELTATARADLDGDGVLSTFTRTMSADGGDGAIRTGPLTAVDPLE